MTGGTLGPGVHPTNSPECRDNEKNPPTFHYTGWLTGILIMIYCNPHITGQYNPLYTLNNLGFFIAQLFISTLDL